MDRHDGQYNQCVVSCEWPEVARSGSVRSGAGARPTDWLVSAMLAGVSGNLEAGNSSTRRDHTHARPPSDRRSFAPGFFSGDSRTVSLTIRLNKTFSRAASCSFKR